MSSKKVLLAALIFGLLAALAMNIYLKQIKLAATNVITKKVLLANVKIPAKSVITADMFTTKDIPEQYVHPDAVTEPEQAIGYVSNSDIAAGEVLLKEKLVGNKGGPVGLSFVVPLGMRAVAIPVNETTSVGGLIKPGDRVDVIGTLELEVAKSITPGQAPIMTRTMVSQVLLQNIEVLAVGATLNNAVPETTEDNGKDTNSQVTAAKNVTLAVPVDKMQSLALMADSGKITLALRSPVDESKYDRPPFYDTQFLQK